MEEISVDGEGPRSGYPERLLHPVTRASAPDRHFQDGGPPLDALAQPVCLDLAPRRLAPGLAVHPLGLGCRSIGSDMTPHAVPDSEWLDGMRSAVEHGANLFDVADTYGDGRAERLLGQVVGEYGRQGVTLKISSKVGHRGTAPHPYAGPHLRHQLEQSLENLNVEQLDLFALPSHDFGPGDRYLGPAVEVLRAMKDFGTIGAIGLVGPSSGPAATPSAGGHARFDELFALIQPDVVMLPFNALTPLALLPGGGKGELISRLADSDTGVLLTSPLAGGLLAGAVSCRNRLPAPRNETRNVIARVLAPLRERLGGHPAVLGQAALRYCLSRGRGTAVVAGFGRADHVMLNYGCLGLDLSPEDEAAVEAAYATLREELQLTRPEVVRQSTAAG
ncbi:aldo/keto reductase [Kitasatospora sp. NPDC088779]|uniref:aldo/keto reductase n=1 Tax=unclassified Kitasatospora TaxID=2633591 RepID=UPI003417621E